MSELDEFRKKKDAFFGRSPQSPLQPEQRAEFTGLHYFPENESLNLLLELDTDVPHDTIEMATSTGGTTQYKKAGTLHFSVDGQEVRLSAYTSGDPHRLFIPFRDLTSGKESYGAGRYIDTDLEPDGKVHIDFNHAYNPYCAYNEDWTCPVPPVENWLPVAIRAGEMAFH